MPQSQSPNVLITGAGGRLAKVLSDVFQMRGQSVDHATRADLDVTDFQAVRARITAAQPDVIIHCAALTHVDRCAENPDEAFRVNGLGTKNVALAAGLVNAAMCYISTNEVFDGAATRPYLEYDATRPINPYGYSKWIGEQAVRDHLTRFFVVRVSWLFAHDGVNFLQKIVTAARAGRPVSVVTDETASPTYTDDLGPALYDLIGSGQYGVYHLANEGEASRYDFARHIFDCFGLQDYPITPITLDQFPRPSRPPTYAPLRNFIAAQNGIRLRHWREAVAAFAALETAKP
jgi:dTDP-4-dehydrorhamnose reductase